MEDCIFCKIIAGKIPSRKVYENEYTYAFYDINPKAEIHILIVPKKHIESVKNIEKKDAIIAGEIILSAQEIAKNNNMNGYKLLFNVGREGGQLVDHLHLHLLSKDWDKPV